MPLEEYVAHIRFTDDQNVESHLLEDHLRKVSKLAGEFASQFGRDWAFQAGLWHDMGKYQQRFQTYIRKAVGVEKENAHVESEKHPKRSPHSTAGAKYAVEKIGGIPGHILAYLIAGHHAGLPDWDGGKGSLSFRLNECSDEYESSLAAPVPEDILQHKPMQPPEFIRDSGKIALWMRMLFSTLVDADFLDTESFMSPDKSSARKTLLSQHALANRFFSYMEGLRKAPDGREITAIRNQIYDQCIRASERESGIYSLTVPTGGGKTLSSLAFALQHAKKHGKDRIIYAIPFTSIIEQNAKVFKEILGDNAVLEHHSNLDIQSGKESARNRLKAENWDAPLIVTTNVQLFESLHASRTSRCRKLHNIANSVIILDEAQQLPRDFHDPITRVMQQLADHFGVTWVLCTATQPELSHQSDSFGRLLLSGLSNVREIVDDPVSLSKKLKRVTVEMPPPAAEKKSWQELASELDSEESVLVIVNTRRNCKELFAHLRDDGNKVHLSAQMCAEHRSDVIEDVVNRLAKRRKGDKRPLRLISTQLIEAGVDVDFPVVYRAMAGLDSIAQSAGRCNREGMMSSRGRVVVFRPVNQCPPGFLRQAEDTTESMLAAEMLNDPLSPQNFRLYFSQLNEKGSQDKHQITQLLTAQNLNGKLKIDFRTAAEKFRLIDNNGVSIVVPYIPPGLDESPVGQWLQTLDSMPDTKWIYRKLQRFTISVPEAYAIKLEKQGSLFVQAGLFVAGEGCYDPQFGLTLPDELSDVEKFII
ncbi:CRISPR-associated helicase/endonuclease Cas3 [Lacimicrobium alkaliphilum]|uniref:CRISPR-associated helicase Cas3 n=1 Tax=Lacimicrobium alkaliphilum TaxID=1526571 RepID=A0ABQ1RDD4_9ALTE|nr:CRISPR-associated helicase/endonuclease Cas3 [Lacimicrobium alkaliphilum]GGD66757.1 CRISPR-associated helicase Cas3 [Lacimicrobium alkaliphilum]